MTTKKIKKQPAVKTPSKTPSKAKKKGKYLLIENSLFSFMNKYISTYDNHLCSFTENGCCKNSCRRQGLYKPFFAWIMCVKKRWYSVSVSASVSVFEWLRKVFCNHFPCRCKYLHSIYSQESSGALCGACFNKNSISLEQIEIFQFCLKILHLWRLPHPWVGGWVG